MTSTRQLAVVAISAAVMTLVGCGASAQRPPRSAPVHSLSGTASYYADSLAGNATANGESYDPERLTAAHRTLPFGARVAVRRLDNGRRVVVRINDRGPFAGASRIIDLSRAAAEALQMIRAGIVRVELEVLSIPPAGTRRASR